MADPVLTAHQVFPNFFNLGGRIAPVSIRDQMVRGQTLIDRAIEAGLIGGPGHRPLLVVGAVAATRNGGIWAATRMVPTVLLEWDSSPFNRQALAGRDGSTRPSTTGRSITGTKRLARRS